jgi:hypothetical protein
MSTKINRSLIEIIANSSIQATVRCIRSAGGRMNKEEEMATYGVAEIAKVGGTPELRSGGNVDLD